MSLVLSKPYDMRRYNGMTRSDAVRQYYVDYLMTKKNWEKVWQFKLINDWEVEILAINLSDDVNNPIYRPIVKIRIPGFVDWTEWKERIPDNNSFYEAKNHALFKLCYTLAPDVIENLFPKALQEENGISKYLN